MPTTLTATAAPTSATIRHECDGRMADLARRAAAQLSEAEKQAAREAEQRQAEQDAEEEARSKGLVSMTWRIRIERLSHNFS